MGISLDPRLNFSQISRYAVPPPSLSCDLRAESFNSVLTSEQRKTLHISIAFLSLVSTFFLLPFDPVPFLLLIFFFIHYFIYFPSFLLSFLFHFFFFCFFFSLFFYVFFLLLFCSSIWGFCSGRKKKEKKRKEKRRKGGGVRKVAKGEAHRVRCWV